jgi:hypothetical protein
LSKKELPSANFRDTVAQKESTTESFFEYASLPVSAIYTLTIINFNIFYNYPFNLFRNYAIMSFTALAIGICLFLYVRVSKIPVAKVPVRSNLRRILISISPILFGIGTVLRNQKISDSLALVVFLFFVIMSLAYFFSDKFASLKHASSPVHLFVNLPILSFLLYSRTYGDVKNLNAFESFHFSNAQLLSRGLLPWRDFSTEHGLWESGFREFLGGFFVEHTIWGQLNGLYSFITPLEVCVATICIYLVSRNFLFAVAALGINRYLETNFGISMFFPRMLIVFVLIVVLIRYFGNRNFRNLFYLAITVSVGLIWSHEFFYLALGILFSIILVSYHFRDGFFQIFSRCFGLIFGTGILLFIELSPFGLFSNYLDQFVTNASGYFFAWGMSFQWGLGFLYHILFFVIPALLFVYLSKTLTLLRNRHPMTPSYLALMPIALCSLLFYFKFLNWADWHLFQPANLLLILLVFWAALTLTTPKMQVLGITSSAVLAFTVVTSFNTGVGDLQYVSSKNYSTTIGHMDPASSAYESRIANVRDSFQDYIGGEKYVPILDFANEPLTWFGVSKFRPAAGIDKVLNIASASSQNSAISRLKDDMPVAVIWGGEYGYWDALFNGTWMRQYELTRFILKNFKPVAVEGRYVLMMRGTKFELNRNAREVMIGDKCDWALGSPKFTVPKKVEIFKAIQVSKFIERIDDRNISNFSPNSTFTDIGFAVQSDRDAQIKMTGIGSTQGQIIFTVNRSEEPEVVWLGGCSAWFYQHENSEWNVEFGEAKVKFFPVKVTNE